MKINISIEDVKKDDALEVAERMLKIIEESQSSVKERLGFGPSKTKKTQDFYSELASSIASKISKKIFKMDYTPKLAFTPPAEAELEDMPLQEFVLMILQFEEEAADEIFGDE